MVPFWSSLLTYAAGAAFLLAMFAVLAVFASVAIAGTSTGSHVRTFCSGKKFFGWSCTERNEANKENEERSGHERFFTKNIDLHTIIQECTILFLAVK